MRYILLSNYTNMTYHIKPCQFVTLLLCNPFIAKVFPLYLSTQACFIKTEHQSPVQISETGYHYLLPIVIATTEPMTYTTFPLIIAL